MKAESLWQEGTFLGLKGRTSEVIVADSDGKVRKCRTLRARPDDERWNADRLMEVNDSVATGYYGFRRRDDDTESEADGDVENNEKDDPVEDEEAVAEVFAPDDDEEEGHTSDQMDSSDDDDPDRLNLLEDIKQLEEVLSLENINVWLLSVNMFSMS